MAITITHDNTQPSGTGYPGKGAFSEPLWNSHRRVKVITGVFALDNSYPTGGYDISGALFFDSSPLRKLLGCIVGHSTNPAAGAYLLKVDTTNKKLMAYWFNYPGASAAAATEVTNGTDLSAVTGAPFFAWGI